jgi:hypothetical protein
LWQQLAYQRVSYGASCGAFCGVWQTIKIKEVLI